MIALMHNMEQPPIISPPNGLVRNITHAVSGKTYIGYLHVNKK